MTDKVGYAEPSKVEDSIIFYLLIFLTFLMSAVRVTGQGRELGKAGDRGLLGSELGVEERLAVT